MDIYLFVFITLFFFITFFLPTWRVYRKTGINPFVLPKNDSVYGFVGLIFRVLIVMFIVAVLIETLFKKWEAILVPIDYLKSGSLNLAGWIMLHVSVLVIIIAQWQMSTSWRIGIDEKHKTELVTSGLFRISRNPIFMGLLMTLCGVFLIKPSAVTLLVACLSWTVIQVQVRLEEEHLEQTNGSIYLNYKKKVRRWI